MLLSVYLSSADIAEKEILTANIINTPILIEFNTSCNCWLLVGSPVTESSITLPNNNNNKKKKTWNNPKESDKKYRGWD